MLPNNTTWARKKLLARNTKQMQTRDEFCAHGRTDGRPVAAAAASLAPLLLALERRHALAAHAARADADAPGDAVRRREDGLLHPPLVRLGKGLWSGNVRCDVAEVTHPSTARTLDGNSKMITQWTTSTPDATPTQSLESILLGAEDPSSGQDSLLDPDIASSSLTKTAHHTTSNLSQS